PAEVDALEDRLYEYNREATGRHDGMGLGFVLRDVEGRLIGAANGYTWAGISELRQLWVDAAYRGRGHGRALLQAFMAEAKRRGAARIWTSSYDFQAPALYEKMGFRRRAELAGFPEGHVSIILCKELDGS